MKRRILSDKYIDSEIAKIDAMFEKTQNEPANFPSKLNDDGETVYVCQSLRNELFEHIRHRVRQSYVQGFWYGWSLRDGMKDTE